MIIRWLPAIIGLLAALAGLINLFTKKGSFLKSGSLYYLSSAIIFTAIFYIAKVDSEPTGFRYQLASFQQSNLNDSISIENSFVAASAGSESIAKPANDYVKVTILSYPKAKVYIGQEYRGKTPLTVEIPKAVNIPFKVKAPISPIGRYEVYKGVLNEIKDSTINVWLKQR